MKYTLFLSITILGCVQFISVASCDEDPKPPVSEVRPLKKGRLAPIEEEPVIESSLDLANRILSVEYQDVFRDGNLWLDCGAVRIDPDIAVDTRLAEILNDGIVRVLREVRFRDGTVMDSGMLREDAVLERYFEGKIPKAAYTKSLAMELKKIRTEE